SVALVCCVGDSSSSDGGSDATTDISVLDSSSDANEAGSDASDAGAACALGKPFGPLVPFGGDVNGPSSDDSVWLTADSCTIFVSSARADDAGLLDNIYTSSRSTADAAFPALSTSGLASINAVASGYGVTGPILSADGLTLFFDNGFQNAYD